jgi:hypothetical protein
MRCGAIALALAVSLIGSGSAAAASTIFSLDFNLSCGAPEGYRSPLGRTRRHSTSPWMAHFGKIPDAMRSTRRHTQSLW